MYTQRLRREDIPSNYSGNAFRYPPIGSLAQPQGEDAPREASFADDARGQDGQADVLPSETADVPSVTAVPAVSSAVTPPSGLAFLKNGIGGEELLLIGLLLLLSGGERQAGQRDILPYLLALIFCA